MRGWNLWPITTQDYLKRKRIEEKSLVPFRSVRSLRPIDLSHQEQWPVSCDSLRHWVEPTRRLENAQSHRRTDLSLAERDQDQTGQGSNRGVFQRLFDSERLRRRFAYFEEEHWPGPPEHLDRLAAS